MAETTDEKPTTGEKLAFQAETAKLLHIVANSLYGERDVFLRELISNASDACDRLRYEAITDPALTAGDPEFRVVLTIEKKAKTLTIADNGIGMDRDELIANLGTIARSGTGAFIDSVGEDGDDAVATGLREATPEKARGATRRLEAAKKVIDFGIGNSAFLAQRTM